MRKRALTTVAATIAAGGLLMSTVPASAVYVHPLTKKEMIRSGVRVSDVPTSLRDQRPKRQNSFQRGKRALAPDLCLKTNGKTRYGKKPKRSSESQITLLDDADELRFKETNSNLYAYRNTKQAFRAFRHLRRQAKRCTLRQKVVINKDGQRIVIRVKGRYRPSSTIGGVRGFALGFDLTMTDDSAAKLGVGPTGLRLAADQYSAYHLSGATIVRVEYAKVAINGSQRGVSKQARRYVRKTSRKVTSRVWRAST